MSQIPPNDHDDTNPQRPPDNLREPPHGRPVENNPYSRRDQAEEQDLESDSPYLRADDVQRLNRKALIFLALIVLVLGALAIWLFSGGMSEEEPRRRAVSTQEVVIPDAPRDLPALPPSQPVAPPTPVEQLPPLPVIEDEPSYAMPTRPSRESEGPSLLERRMMDANGAAGGEMQAGMPGPPDMVPGNVQGDRPADGPTSAKPLYKPSTLLLRGTYIRCVLQSRVISDFAGYTSCIVTEPVYSVDGKRLLLPRGSKVQGSYGSGGITGDRVAIVWDRITTPNGLDINMQSPGVDNLGSAGNPGYYNAHWGHRIASSLMISILADAFKYAAAENGPPTNSISDGVIVQNPYESATARNMERLANMAMERNMSRPPTVTINQGTVVNVYVSRDVDFSAVVR